MRRLSLLLLVPALLLAALVPLESHPAAAAGSGTAGDGNRILAVRVIGYSVKGRPIRAYRIGERSAPIKAVFIAAMHGNEAGPMRILSNLRDGGPIAGADIWVILTMNPDGVARHNRYNAHGVDLNRNFPTHWVRMTGPYNSGPRPASEPETRSVMRFLGKIRPRFVVSFHQPLYGVDTSYRKTHNLAIRLSEGLHLPRKVFNCTYGCTGTMTEWFNRHQTGAAITVEYGYTVSDRQANVTGPAGLLAAVFARRLPVSSP